MSIWGKILIGSAGFALGGPIGAILGSIVGHGVDKVRDREKSIANSMNEIDLQTIFATGVIALSAKIAKADGQVTKDEIEKFNEIFEFSSDDYEAVKIIYNEAKESVFDFEKYAIQLARLFKNENEMLVQLLDSLYLIAIADGKLHPNEEKMIADISTIFNIDTVTLESIKSSHKFGKGGFKGEESFKNLEHAYKVLGCSISDTNDQIKNKYRKLAKSFHPDYLVGKGLPEELVDLANDKLAKINAAYDVVSNAKGIK
tara:strand:- start:30 stop:803 length:774 start_codon:yes stop_codon:yes gene_type:complete